MLLYREHVITACYNRMPLGTHIATDKNSEPHLYPPPRLHTQIHQLAVGQQCGSVVIAFLLVHEKKTCYGRPLAAKVLEIVAASKFPPA